MTELIKIEARDVAGSPTQTCDARDLHQFLEVGRDFTNWIKARIEQYGFEYGKDYVIYAREYSPVLANIRGQGESRSEYSPERGNIRGRGKPSTEYTITLDMAKELAMVERNERVSKPAATSSSAKGWPSQRQNPRPCPTLPTHSAPPTKP